MSILWQYLIFATVGLALWYVFHKKLGMKPVAAWALMFVLLVGTGAVAQFLVWPGRY